MMKKILFLLAVTMFAFYSCKPEDDPKPPEPDTNITVDAKKALTGTFIDFWGKGDWQQLQWDEHFREMKEIGFNTVIIQFISYGDNTWFKSSNTFTKNKFPNALPRLLAAAEKTKIDVYIGLYFDEAYWDNLNNNDWLRLHADRCISIAEELNQQFGSNSAFKGWYIPHEPEPDAYQTKELMDAFRDNMLNRVSNKLHTLNNKPVSVAAYFNYELTKPAQLRTFMTWLSQCNLQIIMLQDGVGVNHVSLEKLGGYYAAADAGIFVDNKNYKGEFWTDLETFQETTPNAYIPADIERIKTQLAAELAAPHLTKAVSFQYYSDMCPAGPNGKSAGKLRSDYVGFIKTLK